MCVLSGEKKSVYVCSSLIKGIESSFYYLKVLIEGMESSFPFLGVYTYAKAFGVFIYNRFLNVYICQL